MKNMMQEYLGETYSGNHLRNFCLYWMKAANGTGDAWRSRNDLDCLYFDGNLFADTLMSAWTPVKWVVSCLNRDKGMKFVKYDRAKKDPYQTLRCLADDTETYLPKDHTLTRLLDDFLILAEQRCNYILLPDRAMNPQRFCMDRGGFRIRLYDEVPATLYYIFERDGLGRFFLGKDGKVDQEAVESWVRREHLEMGFAKEQIDQAHVIPLLAGQDAGQVECLTGEEEIGEALRYMIRFLQQRMEALTHKMCA